MNTKWNILVSVEHMQVDFLTWCMLQFHASLCSLHSLCTPQSYTLQNRQNKIIKWEQASSSFLASWGEGGGVDCPGAPLTNFNDEGGMGGSDRGSYFIPQNITTSELVYPKKSLLFLAYPKKSLSPCFATQKNPSVFFRDPKKSRRVS